MGMGNEISENMQTLQLAAQEYLKLILIEFYLQILVNMALVIILRF